MSLFNQLNARRSQAESQRWNMTIDPLGREGLIVAIDGRPAFIESNFIAMVHCGDFHKMLLRIPVESPDLQRLIFSADRYNHCTSVWIYGCHILGQVEQIHQTGIVLSIRADNLTEEVLSQQTLDSQDFSARRMRHTVLRQFDVTATPWASPEHEPTWDTRIPASWLVAWRAVPDSFESLPDSEGIDVDVPEPLRSAVWATLSELAQRRREENSNEAIALGFTKPFCKYYVGSPHLMCSANPHGPCQSCGDFESKGAPTNDNRR
jgi:hypothetical protein